MEPGIVVEYIDRQKIICAVVLEVKKQKLRLLSENNREVKLSEGRLSHKSKTRLDPSMGRDRLIEAMKDIVTRRRELTDQVDIRELWEILNTEQEWIDLVTMTDFCFPEKPSGDHESAVIRAFFDDKRYFKFNSDRFFPNSESRIEQLERQAREIERKNRIIEEGGNWLKKVLNDDDPLSGDESAAESEPISEFIEIIRSVYLFEKESKYYDIGKAMFAKAGVSIGETLFQLLVKLNVWDQDENLELYQYDVPISFSDKAMNSATELAEGWKLTEDSAESSERRDLTMLPLMTIDGQATLDYDDALSFEDKGDHYCVGVHIADVAYFIRRGDPIDQDAVVRASSIYMPDQKISMLPPCLSEGLCSLKAGEVRPAISTMINLSPSAEVIDYEIVPSLIRVRDQLTYNEVNQSVEEEADEHLLILHDIAGKFRRKRLADGAVQITLPEINIWLEEDGELVVSRTDRETPGRLLVSEIMIMANWLMADFLSKHGLPAIYRSQPGPKERLYKDEEGSIYQNWMQRKLLSRFVLGREPERHSGLGLDAYVTATSPIRKYSDLITQRQIRAVFGLEEPYTPEKINHAIQVLEQPMSSVSRVQFRRKRYWMLKHLEGRIGEQEEAIILNRRRNDYVVLLTEYMTECLLPISGGINLKPEDVVQVTIQHASARKDALSVFMG
ncbi:RNB domain-containing ribonuclease [Desulfobacterales bacterium HSG2]|nr:RNB domain-containing ribonuclease [Desulfobacterales bacterium HSG2]